MKKSTEVKAVAENGVQILAIASVPVQMADFNNLFSFEEGFKAGTVFPELYLPYLGERRGV